MKRLAVAACLFGAAACSNLDIHSDHDPRVNFSNYHTYAWNPSSKAPDMTGVPSDLVQERIEAAVDQQLSAKGMRRVPADQKPDLWINDYVTLQPKVEGTGPTYGFGYGYGPFYGTYAAPAYDTWQYTQGTLVLDFVDSGSRRLVWRGIASDIAEPPDKSSQKLNEIVAKTLKNYPPQAVATNVG